MEVHVWRGLQVHEVDGCSVGWCLPPSFYVWSNFSFLFMFGVISLLTERLNALFFNSFPILGFFLTVGGLFLIYLNIH
jgi:signal transduction histidine kinase